METVDVSKWPTKRETAAALNMSEKSVERWVTRGRLEQRTRATEGRAPITVFNPVHIQALREEQRPDVLPAVIAPNAIAQRPDVFEGLPALLARLADFAEGMKDYHKDRVSDTAVYVSIGAAQRITGLSRKTLLTFAGEGRIAKIPYGRGVRYRRLDLEAL